MGSPVSPSVGAVADWRCRMAHGIEREAEMEVHVLKLCDSWDGPPPGGQHHPPLCSLERQNQRAHL